MGPVASTSTFGKIRWLAGNYEGAVDQVVQTEGDFVPAMVSEQAAADLEALSYAAGDAADAADAAEARAAADRKAAAEDRAAAAADRSAQ